MSKIMPSGPFTRNPIQSNDKADELCRGLSLSKTSEI